MVERKQLIYNVLQDIWKVAQLPESNKSKAEMTDEDWHKVIETLSGLSKKYYKDGNGLTDAETYLATETFMAFMNLLERDINGYEKSSDENGRTIWIKPKKEAV